MAGGHVKRHELGGSATGIRRRNRSASGRRQQPCDRKHRYTDRERAKRYRLPTEKRHKSHTGRGRSQCERLPDLGIGRNERHHFAIGHNHRCSSWHPGLHHFRKLRLQSGRRSGRRRLARGRHVLQFFRHHGQPYDQRGVQPNDPNDHRIRPNDFLRRIKRDTYLVIANRQCLVNRRHDVIHYRFPARFIYRFYP